ncbi:hypothetical protein F3Y22_tig00116997pilonHSYRG00237 [Hibiscus syriacus]|uniref:Uncharacterized protein n=1 Tax=Hibiscus syriacus TaxID=106335 RepID=A0A6A2WE68_HIBSY|nr:hypothetical protein F3Y22_tig00116997pilonHSYRG00237 [Hibiscus syriacus]
MAPPTTRAQPAKRRQTLSVTEDPKTMKKRNRLGQPIGVTVVECTAVCCCFPCSIVELLVLALYKFPARVSDAKLIITMIAARQSKILKIRCGINFVRLDFGGVPRREK